MNLTDINNDKAYMDFVTPSEEAIKKASTVECMNVPDPIQLVNSLLTLSACMYGDVNGHALNVLHGYTRSMFIKKRYDVIDYIYSRGKLEHINVVHEDFFEDLNYGVGDDPDREITVEEFVDWVINSEAFHCYDDDSLEMVEAVNGNTTRAIAWLIYKGVEGAEEREKVATPEVKEHLEKYRSTATKKAKGARE